MRFRAFAMPHLSVRSPVMARSWRDRSQPSAAPAAVATATARDAAYVAQQKASHGQALNVQKAYAMEGTAPALKAAATTIVPVVEHHIMELKAL